MAFYPSNGKVTNTLANCILIFSLVVLPRNYDFCSSFIAELLVFAIFPINCRNSRYYSSGPTYLGFNLCPSMSPILVTIPCLLEENFPLRLLGNKAYKCPCNGLRS